MEVEQETPAPADQPAAPDEQAEQQDQAQQPEPQQDEQAETAEAPARSKSPREALERAFKEAEEGTQGKARGEVAEGPARGADGKFVAKDGEATDQKAEQAADKAAEKPADKPADDKSPISEPPARISADAKAEWDKAPESVKGEFHRAVREMEQGIEQYKNRVEPLDPYFKMAEQHGVQLADVIGQYVNLENMLRQDPMSGLRTLAQNMGATPEQLGQMLLGQQPGQPDQRDQHIMQLEQKIAQLEQGFGGVQQTMQQQREQAVLADIEKFAQANPRFDELAGDIAEMLQTGYAKDLQDAYEKAERLKPAPAPEPQDAAPAAPAQTRQPKSLTGAPSPGSNPKASRSPSQSPREALKRAFGA